VRLALWLALFPLLAGTPNQSPSHDASAVPEMARLAKALVGDWKTEELVQNGKPVPPGKGRRGESHVRLAGGGTALVSEGHSAGEVGGELRWFITIWWDADSKAYRILTCFRVTEESGCELRGTGHWEAEDFVNDYEEMIDGRKVRMQDRWTKITSGSHKLTELHDDGRGEMKPYVVSFSKKR
jgi:hypothetical protein